MITLCIVLISFLVLIAFAYIAFLAIKKSMEGIGNVIMEQFEKETQNLDSIDELIVCHCENSAVDYAM